MESLPSGYQVARVVAVNTDQVDDRVHSHGSLNGRFKQKSRIEQMMAAMDGGNYGQDFGFEQTLAPRRVRTGLPTSA